MLRCPSESFATLSTWLLVAHVLFPPSIGHTLREILGLWLRLGDSCGLGLHLGEDVGVGHDMVHYVIYELALVGDLDVQALPVLC